MENMTIEDARYIKSTLSATPLRVVAVIDGVTMSVPLDLSNRHFAEITRQVEAGTLLIAEAE